MRRLSGLLVMALLVSACTDSGTATPTSTSLGNTSTTLPVAASTTTTDIVGTVDDPVLTYREAWDLMIGDLSDLTPEQVRAAGLAIGGHRTTLPFPALYLDSDEAIRQAVADVLAQPDPWNAQILVGMTSFGDGATDLESLRDEVLVAVHGDAAGLAHTLILELFDTYGDQRLDPWYDIGSVIGRVTGNLTDSTFEGSIRIASATGEASDYTITANHSDTGTWEIVDGTWVTLFRHAEPKSLVINLFGSNVIYSVDGEVTIQGQVNHGDVQVTIDGVPVDLWVDELRQTTSFVVGLQLDPGDHQIEIASMDATGAEAMLDVTVIVDPSMERHLAYLTDIDLANGSIVADYIQWFTGDAAVAAAREDGEIGADEDLPNDFYIRNENPRLRTLRVADDPVIVLKACYPNEGHCVVSDSVDTPTFDALVADPESGVEITGWHWVGLNELPYWLTIQDGTVVQIVEQYIP